MHPSHFGYQVVTTAQAKQIHRLSDFVIEEVSLVDRPANKRRFLMFKRDEGTEDITDVVLEGIVEDLNGGFARAAADDTLPTPAKTKPAKVSTTMTTPAIKGIEAVEQIFFKVGDAVDRLMRVASVTLQADSLKLEDAPNAATVVKEIEEVQAVLTAVKEEIATAKSIAKTEATEAPDAPKGAVETLEEVAAALRVRKAGAAMSAARLKRFASALNELKGLLGEVQGDTTKGMSTAAPPTLASAPAAPVQTDVEKSLRGELADLRKQVQVLKSAPAPSNALAVEPTNEPAPVQDYDWPQDMNKPLGSGDVPVEKSFHV